ncbi:hypothetical protein [Altererythrobacter sp. Root672]|uniref:hypothetical protein n=1 Tax=Altererythrobacter sp. Root672 TaxID=1736584 RepID=UPI0006F1CDC7|nr:hypothetical protein [Altererythrobacter sp. Root672]KRA81251.1 hypothetical protein ASD76_11750 [Altererythrobacter sp. Root672]
MAASVVSEQALGKRHKLSVVRLLVSGAATGLAIFVLCWIGTAVPFSSPTHAYISLFTNAQVNSGAALVEGSVWSLLFGGLSAGLFGIIYNLAAPLESR